MGLRVHTLNMDTLQIPPLHRFSMVYRPFVPKNVLNKLKNILMIRRSVLFVLVLSTTALAGIMVSTILGPEELRPLKYMIISVFMVLFGWISITFWTCLLGFIMLMRRHDPFIIRPPIGDAFELSFNDKIAIVMPIYNEDVPRVFGRLRVMYESLQETGQLEHFSFFVLSDTNQPQKCRQEENAWGKLCHQVGGEGKIFYRRRKMRIHKKSGNISDFCRRWGTQYKYMITLDADSLMSGQKMISLARIMESREDIGILQTSPKGINQKSLISRINQFSSYVYGPLHLAGSYFWQLQDAGYWGHNAIIRLEPFMKFCALPKLSGSLPFGGEILSHDFVEAALMRRAGWGVWLGDLEDSYEELPPDLLTELERDARWCRGNIQHLRLMFMRGFSFGHRLLFFNGNMFYFSSFLWLVLLILMTVYAIIDFFHKPQYFPTQRSFFPHWPVHHQHLSMDLLLGTMALLFFPKILSVIWIVLSHRRYLFGGVGRLSLSVFLETIFSILLAPIRMLFHSWFVMSSLLGGKFEWNKQTRHSKGISFLKAFRAHWVGSVMALVWALVTFAINQTLFLWISIIVVPLLLAIPISMIMSYPRLGSFFKKWGLFLTPMEILPSMEVIRLNSMNNSTDSDL